MLHLLKPQEEVASYLCPRIYIYIPGGCFEGFPVVHIVKEAPGELVLGKTSLVEVPLPGGEVNQVSGQEFVLTQTVPVVQEWGGADYKGLVASFSISNCCLLFLVQLEKTRREVSSLEITDK